MASSYPTGGVLRRVFPEQRLFLRSDAGTRYVRLAPLTQAVALTGTALLVGWAIVATAILLMDSIGSGNIRDQAQREQALYEERLNALSVERDARASEALKAQERFATALREVSEMQSALLASEDRRRELERGIEVIQATLRRTMQERDGARAERELLAAELAADGTLPTEAGRIRDTEEAFDTLTVALSRTAAERDLLAESAARAEAAVEDLVLDARLEAEKNDRIFAQLEEAVSVSLEPLDAMFREAGLDPDEILQKVRNGYAGQGGPLAPISFSTKGGGPDPYSLRANDILERLDEMNLYRIGAQKLPLAHPLKTSFRLTSAFGGRDDPLGAGRRMHNALDMAGGHADPIHATGDGVVTFAGRQSGYGNFVKIKHEFGIETRYAHMSSIAVKVGQKVSRGDRIGAMGSTGRSTGTHLHYEVRVSGEPVDPMTFIKAAKDVF